MNTCKYIRNEIEDTYGILALQDKILEIMVYIDKFCKAHGITYYLMGGSALGAIRHQGFIPWDDDLDIFMDYRNFRLFEEACKTDLDKEKYYYQAMNSTELPHYFAKLRMNGTAYIEEGNIGRKVHQGIFVDIMCLNNAAPDGWRRKAQFISAGLLKGKAVTMTNYQANSIKKKLEMTIAKTIVRGPVKKYLIHEVFKYNNKPSVDKAHVFGKAKYVNSYYPAKDFGEPRYVPFEKVLLAVPSNVEHYLSIRYGDSYMEMPSEETKAMYKSHPVRWDTERSYEEYLNV